MLVISDADANNLETQRRLLEIWPETRFSPSHRFLYVDYRCNNGLRNRITYTTTPYKTGIRLLRVVQNPANGFPARLLGNLNLLPCIVGVSQLTLFRFLLRQVLQKAALQAADVLPEDVLGQVKVAAALGTEFELDQHRALPCDALCSAE